ncbi:MAG: cell division protein FtsL [Alphaproteobacteria bacterium]
MIRPTSFILMVLAAAAGGALFQVAFEVSELDDELAQLNRDIRNDRDAIHVLRAEWSFLNQPERLEELTRRHLDLLPVTGGQIAGTGAVPVLPQAELPTTGSNIAGVVTPAAIPAAAPRAKPAAPAPQAPVTRAADKPNRADLGRSLDDVLREVMTTPAAAPGVVQR